MAGSKMIVAPNGAFGYSAPNTMFTLATEMTSDETSTTIAANDCVMWSTTLGKVKQSTTAGNLASFAGVALEAIAPGGTGLVAVYGYAKAACDAATQFDILEKSPTTAGRVKTVASTATGGIGSALTTMASNLVDIWINGVGGPTA